MKRQILVSFCILLCAVAWAAVEPVHCQKLVLLPGWNLVTLRHPLESKSEETFLALKPVALKNKSYVQCNSSAMLKPGCGYWVFSRKKETLELVQDATQIDVVVEPPTLVTGWNLVGYEEGWPWPETASEIWDWDVNAGFVEVKKDALVTGSAYFVLVK